MADFADLGMRFLPVQDQAANRALDQVVEKSDKATKATDALAQSQDKAKSATAAAAAEFAKQAEAVNRVQQATAAAANAATTAARSNATALDYQAQAAKRLADQMERVKRGELVQSTNPLNGVTSFAPPGAVKELASVTAAVNTLAGAQKALATESAVAGATFSDFFVENDFAREYQQTTAAAYGTANATKSLSGNMAEAAITAAAMFGAMAVAQAIQFAIEALTSAFKQVGDAIREGEQFARGYADAMVQAEDAINGVATATFKLSDATKELARQNISKQVSDIDAALQKLEHPDLKTAIGRFAFDAAGTGASAIIKRQVEDLKAQRAGLQAEGIRLFLSDEGKGAKETTAALKALLPQETRLAQIQDQRAAILKGMASGQIQTVLGLRALANADKEAEAILHPHTKARVAHTRALSDEAREYERALKAAQAYAENLREQADQIGMTEEERVAYRAGLALEELAQVKSTAATEAATAAIIANRDALIQRMGVAELEAAGKARQGVLDNAPNATPKADAANAEADRLSSYADLLDQVANHTQTAANDMAGSFGRVGDAVGSLMSVLTDLDAKQSDIAARRADEFARYQEVIEKTGGKGQEAATAEIRWTKAQTLADREARMAQIKGYADQIGAFKGLFSEKSRIYKALTVAEQAYRLFEMAMAVKTMIAKVTARATETAATVTGATVESAAVVAAEGVKTSTSLVGAAIRIPVKIAEGAASIFAALGPFGFPVVAAMLAVMAGLGFGGKGGSTNVNIAEERQKTQGTGSVLGDATAKSNSIAKSLEIVAANSNKDLEYYNPMLRALRSIDSNIGSLTASLARQLGVGGSFDTSKLGLGSSFKSVLGGTLGRLLGIGTKTTTTLLDQGIEFDPQTLGAIASGGLNGSTYQDIATNKKKSFLGITYSNKTKNSTVTGSLDADIIGEVQRVIASLRDGVLSAAGILGVEGAKATLDAFQVDIGKISFKDMTGQEIQDTLNAVFSKLGDDLASSILPDLAKFQKAGEGAFETLARVARGYQVLDTSLASIGKTFGAVGVASLEARQRLIDLTGSIDDFASQTQFFADNFLSDIERMAPIQASVSKELTRLGLSGITTKDQFKQVVLGLDLTTQAGAEMYAALMALAPAFAKVADYVVDGSKELQDAREALTKAYQNEADALQTTIDKFQNFSDSLKKFRDSLDTGPSALLSPEAQYKATQSAFLDVSAKAKLGDATALSNLQSVSQAYLDASKAYYASSGPYFKDLEQVKAAVTAAQGTAQRTADNATQQLAALKESVKGLIDINESVLSVRDAILALQAVMAKQDAATAAATKALTPATGTATGTGGTGGTGGAGGFNGAGYLAANPDVMAAWQDYQKGTGYYTQFYAPGLTAQQFAEAHYNMAGKDAGYVGFATGGSFMVGGTGGPDSQNFGPMNLTPGEMVNVSTGEAGNDNAEVVALLKEVISELRADKAQRAAVAEAVVGSQERGAKRISEAVEGGSATRRLAGGGAI